jgi:hypothetical protein
MNHKSVLLPYAAVLIFLAAILACRMPRPFFDATPTPEPSLAPATTTPRPQPTAILRPTSSIPTLQPETMQRLEINTGQTLQLQPGESYQLKLGTTECCYVFVDVPVDATWSVSPQNGVTLDPVSGLLEVSASAEHGAAYTITANVENSRKVLTTPLLIYTPEGNPLAGTWYEAGVLPCGGGAETTRKDALSELVLDADGTIKATWYPFEIYHDYWGKYSYDLATGVFAVTGLDGHYIPPDLDPTGTFEIDSNGDLLLKDMWLGSWQGEQPPPGCGQRFKRR